MPSKFPSTSIWLEMAERIGCDVATIKAVFEVEAAGKFFESNGKLPRRFEPHHFPEQFWPRIGFNPGKKTPWRASLAMSTSARRRAFDQSEQINAEATYKAASWGAPQIMGFNHRLTDHQTAAAMVVDMETGADAQIRAFVAFVENAGLATHLRSQNWLAFAAGYNGNGQAPVYARKIESAYRRQSGGSPSARVLRLGQSSQAVHELQLQLLAQGYDLTADGIFGAETLEAVRSFQAAHSLVVDGVAGAATQRAIVDEGGEPLHLTRAEKPETAEQGTMDTIIKHGSTVLGSGGAVTLLTQLNDTTQTLLVGGLVVGGLALAALFILRKAS